MRMRILISVLLAIMVLPGLAQDGMTYNEAPMLADMVAAGDLPPVEERLPDNPIVFDGPDGIGVYSGEIRRVELAGVASTVNDCFIAYEPLVRYNVNWEIEPNLAESWEINDEATEYTFFLRQGVKWSDGIPFTADDLTMWWELTQNDETGMSPLRGMVDLQKIDDYTVTFVLESPNALFLNDLAHPGAMNVTAFPRHYTEQFVPDYNENAAALAEEAGLENWAELLDVRVGIFDFERFQGGTPTLGAWMGEGEVTTDETRYTLVRNPYYFKVDSAGNQYPYFDRVVVSRLGDSEVISLRVAAGEVDFQRHWVSGVDVRPFYIENQEAGNYRILDIAGSWSNSIGILVNMTHVDPMHAEINSNKDFRIGLSHALNREEMIDILYLGMLEPHQVAPLTTSPYYNEQLATQYLEYNVDLANEYLDKVLPEKDGDGYRLGPDGERYSIVLLAVDRQNYSDISELLARYWEAVGVQTQVRLVDRTTGDGIIESHEHDVRIWTVPGGLDVPLAAHPFVVAAGTSFENISWAPGWWRWYYDPNNELVVEPPDVVKRQTELYRQALGEPDPNVRLELWNEILQITADGFFNIGLSTPEIDYFVVHNSMRNIPNQIFFDWPHGLTGNYDTYAFFRAEE